MKFDTKKLSATKLEVKFSLSPADVAEAESAAVKELAPTIKVKGFRAGKAPMAVIKKEINPNALADKTIEIAINKSVTDYLVAEKIMPLDRPEIAIEKFVPSQEIEYKATFEVVPPIKLPNYKKLKVKAESVKVSDDEVEATLKQLAQSYSKELEVKRAAKLGDRVLIDFEGFKDGQPFAGGKSENYTLELGANQFIPGFEEGIIGKKAGDKFDLELSFPADYHSAELKGAKVVFKVNLHKVNQVEQPKIDDEFAVQTNMFKTLTELKADIKKNLLVQKQEKADEDFKNKLIDELAKQIKIEVPTVLLNDQMQAIERDLVQNLSYYSQTLVQYLESLQKDHAKWMKEDVEPVAISRVKAGLGLAELSKELGITVTDPEVDAQVETMRTQYASNPEVLSHLDHDHSRRDIRSNLITTKTIAKLVEFNS